MKKARSTSACSTVSASATAMSGGIDAAIVAEIILPSRVPWA